MDIGVLGFDAAPPWLRVLAYAAYAGAAAWAIWILATRSSRRLLRRKVEELLRVQNELREANALLERLSLADPLTGIANRRKLDEELDQAWAAAMRDRGELAVLMIDIDHFKAYNDHYGHQAGDECLRRVAGCLVASLERATDFVGRYGGEEFLVILPRVDEEGALLVAERLRRAVERLLIPHLASEAAAVVTISVGVAALSPQLGRDKASLVKSADIGLYRAKGFGRNRVAAAEDPVEPPLQLA